MTTGVCGGDSPRVVIITASVGGGHDGPARELARQLTARHVAVEIVDLVHLAPAGSGRALRSLFRAQLTCAPQTWGRWFQRLDQPGVPLPAAIRMLIAATAARINKVLAGDRTYPPADLAISTFPLGGHLLAAARRTGPCLPTVTYITDPAVHRLWLAPGTDRYLTTWLETARELSAVVPTGDIPRRNVVVEGVFPAVRPEFRSADLRSDGRIRTRLGLPPGRLALLSSGSWGVGAVLRTALDVAQCTDLTPVVVCGRNAALRRHVARVPGVVAVGWVDDMAALMRICDVAVLNSGGLTLAEATVCGLPVIHYRPLPGQGVANAQFGARTGASPWCAAPEQLTASIRAACAAPPHVLPVAEPAERIVDLITASPERVTQAG
jgi:UDP-N-acetylglucosamine:LPS N-acetylglucosamine transferase